MTSTTNPFGNLFADKDLQATERSLRAHKGVLTKLTCYIDTAVNAVNVLPLSLIHISEPTRLGMISYAVFCLKKKK